ncbi:MAG TPA: nitroreductase family protein [Aggregatilineaceae bacterium]|nr:nitroreductase family protein [Aggregatilineaceae bacterium]
MFKDLVCQNRSYRRFDQSHAVDSATLRDLVELARLVGSGMNLQPLRYIVCADPTTNATIFKHLTWARYLEDWGGPAEGERPTAYIIILGDSTIKPHVNTSANTDFGIAAQTILLGAVEQGLGGCMIGSINRNGLRADLQLEEHYEILLVLALGKPAETVVIDPIGADGSVKYWRDENSVHHVPKRSLDEILIKVIG